MTDVSDNPAHERHPPDRPAVGRAAAHAAPARPDPTPTQAGLRRILIIDDRTNFSPPNEPDSIVSTPLKPDVLNTMRLPFDVRSVLTTSEST
jgi:hypothetical protein